MYDNWWIYYIHIDRYTLWCFVWLCVVCCIATIEKNVFFHLPVSAHESGRESSWTAVGIRRIYIGVIVIIIIKCHLHFRNVDCDDGTLYGIEKKYAYIYF